MTAAMNEAKTTVRFTVDLPLSLHQALTDLAQQQGKRKAVLVRWAIAQVSLEDARCFADTARVGEEAPLQGETKRFTLDMEPGEHEKFSILAIRMRRRKADLVRWAIGRLVNGK